MSFLKFLYRRPMEKKISKVFRPSDYQANINIKDFIAPVGEVSKENSIELDVLFVGAGPASLSSAIHLAHLSKSQKCHIEIGIMEKADQIGGHSLSGAVVHPLVFHWLFPDKKIKDFPFRKEVKKESFYYLSSHRFFPLPVPPGMKNQGHWTASLCEIVRFLAREAELRGVHIFTSFPADKLLMDKNKVKGVLSKEYGRNKDGSKEADFNPPNKIFAKVVVLAEGSRGHLSQAYLSSQNIQSLYPQTYALGVKEIWQTPKDPEKIVHSIGWPLPHHTFGGSWLYPLGEGLISLGLVAGLDSPSGDLSVQDELQKIKTHPLFKKYLEGGKCVEWGAKTIPEGGWQAVPHRISGDGLLILGDSAGFVDMASLKGIHYAMASGYYSAETLFKAFKERDFSAESLKDYDQRIKNSFIFKDLYKSRNLRQSFQKGLFLGLLWAGLITFTKGRWPKNFKKSQLKTDSEVKKKIKWPPSASSDKSSIVYLSGNRTRDKIPSHLIVGHDLPLEVAHFYERMCPAGVYKQEGELSLSPTNCIDCKATDILGPKWTPKERGSGPNYKLM